MADSQFIARMLRQYQIDNEPKQLRVLREKAADEIEHLAAEQRRATRVSP